MRVYKSSSNGWTGGSILGPDMQDIGAPGWFPTNILDRYDERYWPEDNGGFAYNGQYGEHGVHGGAECNEGNHDANIENYDPGFGDNSGEMYDETYNRPNEKPYSESFEAGFNSHYAEFDNEKSYAESFEPWFESQYAEFDNEKPYPEPLEAGFEFHYAEFDKLYVQPVDNVESQSWWTGNLSRVLDT